MSTFTSVLVNVLRTPRPILELCTIQTRQISCTYTSTVLRQPTYSDHKSPLETRTLYLNPQQLPFYHKLRHFDLFEWSLTNTYRFYTPIILVYIRSLKYSECRLKVQVLHCLTDIQKKRYKLKDSTFKIWVSEM